MFTNPESLVLSPLLSMVPHSPSSLSMYNVHMFFEPY